MALQAALASSGTDTGDALRPSDAISTFTRPPVPAQPEEPTKKTGLSTRFVCVTVLFILLGEKNPGLKQLCFQPIITS